MDTTRQLPSLPKAALLAVLCGCTSQVQARTPPSSPTREIRVAAAERSPQPVTIEVVGTVRSAHDATLAPLISGTVTEVRVGLGSAVRAGQLLVRISARDVDARLEQSRAVSTRAARDRDRALALKQLGAITDAQYEAALSEWNLASARDAEASAVAERTVVRAPFAGVITSKLANVGDAALPGRPLVTLETPAAKRFEAMIPESASGTLEEGQVVPVRIERLERELEGRIAEIQPASDDGTRSRLVKIDLPVTPGLRSGEFGRVLLASGREVEVTVPTAAVIRRGQLETVFVVDSGVARLRLVRCGHERDGRVQISSGLSGGETVALASAAELVDGQQVRVRQ
jgi:RND family efflux transporter MFP subunit